MRIGIITGEYPPMRGGIGGYTDILSRRLQQRGHDVHILSTPNADPQTASIPLTTINNWSLRSPWQVNHWVQEHRFDVVNLQFQTAAFDMSPWVHFMPQIVDAPFVTTFHDLRFPYLFPKAGFLRDWIVMHLVNASSGVIVTDQAEYERVKSHPHAAMIPISSTIATDLPADYDPATYRQQAGITDDETFLIGYFGFINHTKGVDTLLYALQAIRDRDIPARLIIIGGRTGTADPTNVTYADRIDALIDELLLRDAVTYTGFVSEAEIIGFLSASDVVALPFRDGASYRRSTLMAAIQAECAILTTEPAVAIPDFTDETLQLVPPEDATALADALQTLYTTPSRRAALRDRVASLKHHFQWNTIVERTVAFFRQVSQAHS